MLICMWWFVIALLLAPQPAATNPYKEAGAALASGDLAKAQASLEALTVKDPGNARAWLLLAETYARCKNAKGALAAATKSERLGDRDPEVLRGLAFFFADLQPDLKHAADLETRYAELRPSDKTAWSRAAALYFEASQYELATVAGTRALASDDSKDLHTLLGHAYEGKQDWENAAEQFAAAVNVAPYDENARFLLIQLYLHHEDFVHASEAIESARKVFARSPQIELAAGVCAYGMRRFPEALDQFLKTIALAPEVPQPYLFLGRMLDHAGDRLPEVVDRFRQFQERNPRDAAGSLLYAKALIAGLDPVGFPPEAAHAMQLLEQARSLDANQAETHYQIGCLLERKRENAAAAVELERSVALDPREPFAHFHLARVYERLGRKEDALRERAQHQELTEAAAAPGSAETRIQELIDDVARSGRVLEAGELGDRIGSRRQISPGRPPLLEFRYLEGAARHRFGNLDLVIDDAGH